MSEFRDAVSDVPSFTIRQMKLEEFDEVLAIASKNFVHVHRSNARHMYKSGQLTVFVAVFYTGSIIGTCWIVTADAGKSGIISVIELKNKFSNLVPIKEALYQRARHWLSGKAIYINLSSSLRTYFNDSLYIRHWDIHLYNCHTSAFLLKDITSEGCIIKTTANLFEISVFTVLQRDKIIGCGSLRYFEESHWLIGPLTAIDKLMAKFLLNHILLYIRTCNLFGMISVYLIHREGTNDELINEFGFVKHPAEWTRYSSMEPFRKECETSTNNRESTTFALGSIALSMY